MKVRGERECRDCGTSWSYYETGRVECPSCGSLRSVGVGDRKQHTDAGGDLDLSTARRLAGDEPLRRAATAAEDACRDYVQSRGFIAAGDLRDLDDVFVAAQELKHAAASLATRLSPTDDEEAYVLALLQGASDGDRPPADEVPVSLRTARGLGAADAIRAYRNDLRAYLDDADTATPEDGLRFVERLGDHEKRLQAIDGDVPPETADDAIEAARRVGDYVRDGTEKAAARARDALDALP